MEWNQLAGQWKRHRVEARSRWGEITDDWESIAGRRERLVEMLQRRYGMERAYAEKEADDWLRSR